MSRPPWYANPERSQWRPKSGKKSNGIIFGVSVIAIPTLIGFGLGAIAMLMDATCEPFVLPEKCPNPTEL